LIAPSQKRSSVCVFEGPGWLGATSSFGDAARPKVSAKVPKARRFSSTRGREAGRACWAASWSLSPRPSARLRSLLRASRAALSAARSAGASVQLGAAAGSALDVEAAAPGAEAAAAAVLGAGPAALRRTLTSWIGSSSSDERAMASREEAPAGMLAGGGVRAAR
jgi:hypothetical protein